MPNFHSGADYLNLVPDYGGDFLKSYGACLQIHIAAMSTITPAGDELDWLQRDLEAANKNRDKVPLLSLSYHSLNTVWCVWC